ncbi:MAG: CoA transferase [Anaerolineaceae bacterium]|nr:CoA transferase [Anaerolineaceae bacterium]
MAKTTDIPKFGMLSGIKVFSTGTVVAAPFAAMLMAENGATVIHAESSLAPDTCRAINYAWNQEHRNELAMAINIPTPEGKEIFIKMVKWADIWFESSKGGTYAKWGLTDEVIWKENPKLIIVHISGFGQEGDPEYVSRASYDAIGQAFGGYMFINGMPEPNPPQRAVPYTCDYVTALNAAWAALAAYIKSKETGKGESLDIAQFEMMTKIQLHYPMTYFMDKKVLMRQGNADPKFAGYSAYKCQDGNYVFIGLVGGGPMKRAIPILGLTGDPDFPAGMQLAIKGTPAGKKLDEAIQAYCDKYPAAVVDKQLMGADVPCSIIYSIDMAENNSHFIARKVFSEWDDPQYGKVKGVNVFPHAKNNPPKIWRGAPLYGMDNDDVLAEFGYSKEQIDELYTKGVLKAGEGCH